MLSSKILPKITDDSNDRSSSFALGRKAAYNNISFSHKSINVNKNVTYPEKPTVNSKPLTFNDSSSRTQRLRLSSIGNNSTSLKNNSDSVKFTHSYNQNLYYNTLSRVRSSGCVVPKKCTNRPSSTTSCPVRTQKSMYYYS